MQLVENKYGTLEDHTGTIGVKALIMRGLVCVSFYKGVRRAVGLKESMWNKRSQFEEAKMMPPMRSTSSATGSMSSASYVESGCPGVNLGWLLWVTVLSISLRTQVWNPGILGQVKPWCVLYFIPWASSLVPDTMQKPTNLPPHHWPKPFSCCSNFASFGLHPSRNLVRQSRSASHLSTMFFKEHLLWGALQL